jgi:hypothetical protein
MGKVLDPQRFQPPPSQPGLLWLEVAHTPSRYSGP